MAHFVRFGNIGYAECVAEGKYVIRPKQDGRNIYVNADLVTAVYEVEGGVAISCVDDSPIFVAAPVEAVVDKLTRC